VDSPAFRIIAFMSWYVNPFMESIFIADDPFAVVSEDQISPTTHWTKKFIALL